MLLNVVRLLVKAFPELSGRVVLKLPYFILRQRGQLYFFSVARLDRKRFRSADINKEFSPEKIGERTMCSSGAH